MDSVDGKEIKIRCETCRGRGMGVAGEGHYSMSYDFVSAGFSVSHSEGSVVWISW